MGKTDQEIKKLKNEVKEKEKFWMIVYMILILFAVIKNAILQKDLFACINCSIAVWVQVCGVDDPSIRIKYFR